MIKNLSSLAVFIRSKFFFFLSFLVLLGLDSPAQDYGAFNFKDWPSDVKSKLLEVAPELKKDRFTADEIDQVLKKISTQMNFAKLSVVQSGGELYLVGTINSKVQQIEIKGLSFLTEEQAREILALSLNDAAREPKVTLQLEKLIEHYRSAGFRKTQVRYRYELIKTGEQKLILDVVEGPKTVITGVEVRGLNAQNEKSIRDQLFWEFSGTPLTDDLLKLINARLRTLLNQFGLYLTPVPQPEIRLSVNDAQARVVYNLASTQAFEVLIEGETEYSQAYLLNDVLKLFDYTSTDANIGSELLEKLRTFYVESGFSEFSGTYFENKQKGKIQVTLSISEGKQTKIMALQFVGSLSRPESFYRDLFFELSSTLVQEKIFIRNDVDLALKNLITTLQNEGYLKARLNRVQMQPINKRPHEIAIVVSIDEGPKLRLTNLNISGNAHLSSGEIEAILGFRSGSPIGLTQLDQALERLKKRYAQLGFLEMKLLNDLGSQSQTPLLTYGNDLEEARINMMINEGPQVQVGSISIVGNSITHNKLILTELDFKVGEILTSEKLEESVSRLQRTGHFSTIDITTLEAGTSQNIRSVVVKVTEGKPGVITFGVGVTNENDYTFHGYMGVAYRNIGGWGRGASARVEGNYNPSQLQYLESKLTFGFLEPYLLETRARFRLNYTSSRFVSDVNIRKQTIANTATWSIEQDITSNITGIWDIYNISNFVDAGITAEDEQKFGYQREDLVIASVGPTVDFDYRDNVLNPQAGSLSRVSLEYSASSLGNHKVDNFWRGNAQTTIYSPVLIRRGVPVFIWANSLRAGYLKDLDNRTEGVPFDKRGFILGGRSTIRGFETSEIFPSSNDLGTNYRLLSSAQYQLIKSEFRYPLFPKQNIGISLFYDGGQVQIRNVSFSDSWRDSVGIGFHYNTPVGPLNLEYARKLDKKADESSGAFHLSVGVF